MVMKHLRSLVAAVTLTLAAFGISASAKAEPKKETPTYYFIGYNLENIAFMATDVERSGDKATSWALVYRSEAIQVDDELVQATWSKMEFDCKKDTATIKVMEVYSPQGKKLATLPAQFDPIVPEQNSPAAIMRDVACQRPIPVDVVTSAEANEMLGIYVRAYQEAVKEAEKEKAKSRI